MSESLTASLCDPSRLAALREAIQQRPYPHPSFDTITRVIARVLDVPLAMVSLVDDRQQFFLGATGLTAEVLACRSTPLSHSFCQHVVHSRAALRIRDTRNHPLVGDNPAISEFGLLGYLGVPLTTSSGHTLGSLCAISLIPRDWTDADELLLTELAVSVATELELRAELTYREDVARCSDPSIDREGLPATSLDILESVQEGVAAVDREWKLTFMNQYAERVLGINRDRSIGHSLWEQIPFLVGTSIEHALRSASQSRFPSSTEAYVASLKRWFELRIVPVRHGLSVYFHDVTDRREAVEALAVREAQLHHVQKMEAIGTLAGGVAHDFNNLLTVIRANVELLQMESRLRGGDRDELTQIGEAAARASVLTQQLLAFSRKQVVQPKVLDVSAALDTLSPVLQRLLPPNISIETQVYPRIPPILADPGHIEQLLLNLVLNARDAMPDGGMVQVRMAPVLLRSPQAMVAGTLQPGRYLQLVVRDTGVGIAPDVRPRIFEPFFSTKDDGRGSGLGLATVFGIVQQAGGGIAVDTEPGVGTLFRIYLPAVAESATSMDETLSATPAGGIARILVAEDEPGIRSVVQRVLRANGYQMIVAADGLEALRLMESGVATFDLLVTDVLMPGMSGTQLVDAIRSHDIQIPVLLMSGYGDAEELQRQIRQPGVHFLAKPFSAGSLAAAIRTALSSEHRRALAAK